MAVFEVLAVVVLLCNGLTAGVLVSTVLGIIPMMATFPPDRYVVAHKYLWSRYDPFMPICFGLGVLGDDVLILVAPTPGTRSLFATAAALLAVVMLISVTRQVPINRWVRALDPQSLPANWSSLDPRARWRNWNAVRTTLACTGFLLNLAAVAALI